MFVFKCNESGSYTVGMFFENEWYAESNCQTVDEAMDRVRALNNYLLKNKI
jgi:hypothetical protein